MELAIIIAVVVVALVFDYTNGFHDAANAIATSVSTRALTPRVALAMAAVMNFVGAFLGQKVAQTVSEVIDAARRHARPGHRDVRPARRDHLEPDHLVLRPAVVVLARPDRRPGRRGRSRPGATVEWRVVARQGRHPDDRCRRWSRFVVGFAVMLAIMWIFRQREPVKDQPRLPARADRLGRRDGARPRPPGRAEDDGRDLPGAAHRRVRLRRRRPARCG